MRFSYDKLWKLLIDKKMIKKDKGLKEKGSFVQLQKSVNIKQNKSKILSDVDMSNFNIKFNV